MEKQLQQSLSNWPGAYKPVRNKAENTKIDSVIDLPEKFEDFRSMCTMPLQQRETWLQGVRNSPTKIVPDAANR